MIGLGMSSIGYIDNSFFQNYSKLDKYMDTAQNGLFSVFRGMKLSDDDLVRQYVITQLMCNFKLNFDRFKQKFGFTYHDYFKNEHDKLAEFFEDNFLEPPNGGLFITPLGRTFIRNIAMVFDAYLEKDGPGKKPTFSRTI
jgi:oxygen-independent coproporphyrinogen-3 oxidase